MTALEQAIHLNKRIRNLSWELKKANDAYFSQPTNDNYQRFYVLELIEKEKEVQSILNALRDLRDDVFPPVDID